jgi:SAM-dependent methyltransferase
MYCAYCYGALLLNSMVPMVGGTFSRQITRLVPQSWIDPEHGATSTMTLDRALDFLRKTVSRFPERLRNADVLDYGCGSGWQCCALAQLGLAKSITGVDIRLFDSMVRNARSAGVEQSVRFLGHDQIDQQYDVVYSCSSFEHFADPEGELRRMIALTRSGGEIIISFAEPWFSPHGSHMTGYTGLPWSNLIFSEKMLMDIRRRFRNDGATRYCEVEGGLNQMTVSKFERIVHSAGLVDVKEFRLFAVKGLPLVTRLPVIRELLTASVCCVLRKR